MKHLHPFKIVIYSICFALLIFFSAALVTQTALAASKKTNNNETVNVIVVLNSSFAVSRGQSNRSAAADIARSMGLKAKRTFGTALFGFSASMPQGRMNALRKDPRVAYMELDELNHIPSPPDHANAPKRCKDDPTGPGCGGGGGDSGGNDDESQEVPWGIARIGSASNTGNGIHVYIIDSGIDNDHEDLEANLGQGFASTPCVSKGKKNVCGAEWDDDNGHGTHVAGTVGAIDNNKGVIGVAPDVTLHAVKVLDSRGSAFSSEIIAGINWVASHKAIDDVVVANISIGGSGGKTGTCSASGFIGNNAYQEAMCNAARMGVVFVVAAGNEGADAENVRPASYDDTSIAVSAIGQVVDGSGNLTGQLGWPSWSNWGNNSAGWTDDNSAPVAISAPGMGVLSTYRNNKYETQGGTSMASPHVAGAVALFLYSNAQVADYSAFINARNHLLATEEATGGFLNQTGNPHDEDFLSITNY